MRFNNDKLRWSLIDFDSLEDMVRVLEFGAEKYDDNNWKKGLKTTEITESLMRHLFAYLRGEDIDPESGLPHTGHIMCNAMFLSYMGKFKKDFDTRFVDKNKEQKLCDIVKGVEIGKKVFDPRATERTVDSAIAAEAALRKRMADAGETNSEGTLKEILSELKSLNEKITNHFNQNNFI